MRITWQLGSILSNHAYGYNQSCEMGGGDGLGAGWGHAGREEALEAFQKCRYVCPITALAGAGVSVS